MKIKQNKTNPAIRIFIPVLITAAFMMLSSHATGQSGGHAYQFLEMTNSARVAGIGGISAANDDDDLDFTFHNPSLLTEDMHHKIILNYVNYYAGVNYGYAAFATRLPRKGMFAGGIHYLNYGSFKGADESGNLTGIFRAADYSVNFYYSRPVDSFFTAGITVKSIYSDLESYHSTALAFDLGISYKSRDGLFSAGMVFRNSGWQMSRYYPFGEREPLPFNIMAGISQGLKYAPLKFFVTLEHIEKWDLTYESSEDDNIYFGADKGDGKFDIFIDKFMRHAVAGAEFYPGKNLTFRIGYNYRRRQELKVSSKPGMVGFSWGVGLKISRFRINYGRSAWHLAGGVNYFSLSLNIDEFNRNFW